jgi:serine/threonine-protein kinase
VGDTQRVVGYVVGVAGLAGLGVGTAFAAVMKSKGDARNHVAESCNPHCGDADIDRVIALQEDAQSAAKVANIAFVAGSVLAVAGVTIVLTAPSERSPTAVVAGPLIGASILGASARGTF